MEPGLGIRRGEARDVETIVAFNRAMAAESEGRDLDAVVARAGVEGLLARPQAGFYLVAESRGQVLGSLMVTPEWSDWRNGFFWWVQSVYVRPEARRRGVYRALYARVGALARQQGDVCGLRLYVERQNLVARATYEALGMAETPYRLYEAGDVGPAPA
jgi:GNAT superfamily N-acetyltransferase